jgi:peptidyl-prolyl cis-trans isomerase C
LLGNRPPMLNAYWLRAWLVRTYFNEPALSPLMPKQVNCSHILVKTEKEAKDLMARIAAGEKFEDVAKKYSKCPSGKTGGSLGWFGKGQMVAEFEKAAFEGEKGKVIGPVKTQFGYHIIKINDQK